MPERSHQLTRRAGLLVIVIVFLASVYMFTYSARIESTDTLFLFDAVGSFLHEGDFTLDISAGVRPPSQQSHIAGQFYSLPPLNSEVLQVILASPLYWLAEKMPGVGLVHAVYLFNILVCAAAGGVIYLYALTLGYKVSTAVISALVFGLGTAIWPYSKTFFQEPLALLLMLIMALLVEQWRQSRYRSFVLLIGAALALVGAIMSKGAAILALPTLIIIAFPSALLSLEGLSRGHIWGIRHSFPTQQPDFTPPRPLRERGAGGEGSNLRGKRPLIVIFLALALVLILLLLFGGALGISDRLDRLFAAFREPQPYLGIALHSYLLSIGGSFWGTSPVLLLALPGIWLLHRRRSYRYVLAAVTLILIFAVVYALRQGPDWFGGLSWPPRFLLPVLPFALICAFPAIERLTQRPIPRVLAAAFALLCLYSLWIQLSGVSLWWADYSAALPPESGGVAGWDGGLNVVRYLRWVVTPSLWSTTPLDFAWVRVNAPIWPFAFALLAFLCGFLLWRQVIERRILLLPIVFLLIAGAGLRAIYHDGLYQSFNTRLFDMLPILSEQSQSGDVVLLSDLTYRNFFLNYGKLAYPRIVSLPFHPGEQPSPEQPPEIVAANPDVLIHQTSGPLINALAETRDHLWVLASSGPFMPWSVRPVERFMASHYYPMGEVETGPDVRLIEYGLQSAPDPYAFREPENLSDLIYGESLRLVGYDLPSSTDYAPGAILPVSLYWQAVEPLGQDLVVALFLRDASGAPIAQGRDSEPGGGFEHTSTWLPGVPVWDNRALRLPDDVPPGVYRLWVVVYQNAGGNIVNLPAVGNEIIDGYIGVLPTAINIV
jgi:hypothetical protein